MSVKLDHGGEGIDPGDPNARLLHQRDVTLTASTEVAPAGKGPAVALNEDPSLEPVLRVAIAPANLEWHAATRTLSGMIDVKSASIGVPGPLAFGVFVRVGDTERRVGSVTHNGTGGQAMTHFSQQNLDLDAGKAGRVDVILRSSEQVARRTVDLYEIWKGELVYHDVPVTTVTPRQ